MIDHTKTFRNPSRQASNSVSLSSYRSHNIRIWLLHTTNKSQQKRPQSHYQGDPDQTLLGLASPSGVLQGPKSFWHRSIVITSYSCVTENFGFFIPFSSSTLHLLYLNKYLSNFGPDCPESSSIEWRTILPQGFSNRRVVTETEHEIENQRTSEFLSCQTVLDHNPFLFEEPRSRHSELWIDRGPTHQATFQVWTKSDGWLLSYQDSCGAFCVKNFRKFWRKPRLKGSYLWSQPSNPGAYCLGEVLFTPSPYSEKGRPLAKFWKSNFLFPLQVPFRLLSQTPSSLTIRHTWYHWQKHWSKPTQILVVTRSNKELPVCCLPGKACKNIQCCLPGKAYNNLHCLWRQTCIPFGKDLTATLYFKVDTYHLCGDLCIPVSSWSDPTHWPLINKLQPSQSGISWGSTPAPRDTYYLPHSAGQLQRLAVLQLQTVV